MARTVAACALAYEVLSGDEQRHDKKVTPEFIIPTHYGMDDLEPAVDASFQMAVARLKSKCFKVEEKVVTVLEELKKLPIWQFSAVESRGEYEEAYQSQRELFDPRVSSHLRMGRADEVYADSYRKILNQRQRLIEKYAVEMGNKVLLMPTVPIMPPSFKSVEDDEEYGRINLQVLRNPSIKKVMDCCSISLPFKHNGATME